MLILTNPLAFIEGEAEVIHNVDVVIYLRFIPRELRKPAALAGALEVQPSGLTISGASAGGGKRS